MLVVEINAYMRCEILTAVNIKIKDFWDVMSCTQIDC
jgi:hypothetical protein